MDCVSHTRTATAPTGSVGINGRRENGMGKCVECKAFAYKPNGREAFCVVGGMISKHHCNRTEGRIDMDFRYVEKVNPAFSEWLLPNYRRKGDVKE